MSPLAIRPLRAAAISVSAALLGACGSDPVSPGIQPEIVNVADSFSYQVTDVQNLTYSTSYSWQNSGAQATVDQSTTVTGGSATLVVLDANGAQVYSRSLADNGSFESAIGTAGSWVIRVTYGDANATVNFRVQKKT